METTKIKIREIENLTKEEKAEKKAKFAKLVKIYGKKKENNFLDLILNKAGKLNQRNKTKIKEFLELIGRFSRSVSDDGEIVWNVAEGSKTRDKISQEFKQVMNLKIGEKTLIDIIRGVQSRMASDAEQRRGKALGEIKKKKQSKAKVEKEVKAQKKEEQSQQMSEALAESILKTVEQKEINQELEQKVLELETVIIGAEQPTAEIAPEPVEPVVPVVPPEPVVPPPEPPAPVVPAVVAVEAELIEQNELVDAQLEQPQAVEPIEEIPVVDDVALIVINEEEKKAEIEGVEVDVDAENIQLIQDLKLLDTLLKDLLTAINNLGDTSIITGEIVDLDNRTGALNMSAKGKDPEIQTLLRAIQSKYNKERKKAIDKAKNELLIEILVEEKKELDVRLSKALLAIAKIGEQQYNDGLVENRELTPESQLTTESALISDAFDEIGEEIRDNGEVSNDVINTIKDLFDIISRDAQDIIVNVLTNTISEGNVFDLSFVPTRVATGLFIRFLSRVLYSGTEYNDRQGDSMVEGFLNHGGRLEGQNQGVVNRLANALRLVIPRAPRPPLRRPFPALLAGGGVRGLPVEEKSSGLMDEFNRELMRDLETVEEQKVGTFKNLLDKLEKGTEKLAKTGPSVETRDMSDDEFEEQLAEMEDLESNLGVFARAHATATIGRSQAESIRNFASSKIPNFNIPVNAVRNSFRNAPNEIPNILRGVARAVAPIYRRQPGQIRAGRMVHIIMGVLLSAIYSAVFLSTQEGQQEREAGTTEQQTLEQERETDTTEAKRGTTTEFVKGEEKEVRPEDIDNPAGIGLLRADFEMVGIDFFNKQFATTTLDMENSEWAEFSFVPNIDTQNNIEIDNSFGESVRFREPMFMPKYQPKLKPPSQLAINMGRDRMTPAIQLSQGFAPKFSGAVNVYDNLSYTLNNDAFSRSWEDNKLYHPDN